jgi:hypothetical protein
MRLDDKEVKLKIGDVAIFRVNDGVVQFMRGSQRLLNNHNDDKNIVGNELPLGYDLCSNIANIIAMTHGFGVENSDAKYARPGLHYFRFTRIKKI